MILALLSPLLVVTRTSGPGNRHDGVQAVALGEGGVELAGCRVEGEDQVVVGDVDAAARGDRSWRSPSRRQGPLMRWTTVQAGRRGGGGGEARAASAAAAAAARGKGVSWVRRFLRRVRVERVGCRERS